MSDNIPSGSELFAVKQVETQLSYPVSRTVNSYIPLAIERRVWALGGSLGWPMKDRSSNAEFSIHAPSLSVPNLNSGNQSKIVATIHDVIPITNPELLTPRSVKWHTKMIARSFDYADFVACPSQTVKNQLIDYGFNSERVVVIPGAPSESLIAHSLSSEKQASIISYLKIPRSYLLYMGSLEPRKGLSQIVRALSDSGLEDIDLVITGKPGWGATSIEQISGMLNVRRKRVHYLGWIPDEYLAHVIQGAQATLVPSVKEGFGLPILESMALGTPVIHSDDAALSEVAGEAGLRIALKADSSEPVELISAIKTLLESQMIQKELSSLGLKQAAKYSWATSAKLTWALHV